MNALVLPILVPLGTAAILLLAPKRPLLQRSIDKHETAQRWEGPVVFDRGVPDCVAYAALMGTDPTAGRAACERYRYHPEVLVVEPGRRST